MTRGMLLIALLVLVLASFSLYIPLNRGRAKYYLATSLDARIPLMPAFIVAYLALMPFVGFALIVALRTPYAAPLYLALIIGVLGASLTRYFIHGGIRQPEIRRRDVFSRLVHWLYRHDDRAHTFPSSHVLISLTTGYFLALAFPLWAFPIWIAAGLIALSTLFVKQHYLVDVVGGAAFAVAAIYCAGLILVNV